MTNENNAALLAVGVALCASGRRVDAWSRMLTGVTLLLLLFLPLALDKDEAEAAPPGMALAGLIIAFGFCQMYYALRLAFDRPVFAHWLRQPEDDAARLAAFDAALAQLDLRRPAPRPLAERILGVRRLFRRQLLCLAVQRTED
ncbi:MAG: hypothetical protein LBS49_00445 [Candidatus Accumulibacter sp.]|jgi:hypothetical protein|nr:hypothetical protein [Accumulibacter sp.]